MRNFIGVVLAAGALAPGLGAQQLVPGWVVEQKTSVTMVGATAPLSQTRHRITSARGDRRTDIVDGPGAGEYTLLPANGRVMFLVVPARRVAREAPMDAAALAEVVAAGMTRDSGAMKVDTLGDGPVMLGYRTRHFRTRPARLTSVSMPGLGADASERVTVAFVKDYYLSDQLPELEAAGFQQRVPSSSPGHIPGFAGIALRTETYTELGSGGMKSTSVTEVTSIAKSNVDPALFTVPADYAHVSLADEMRALRAHTDSLMREMDAKMPGLSAELKARRNAMFGIRDTTAGKKP